MSETSTSGHSAPDFSAARDAARRKGITAARRHIFLCCDQTTPKCCDRERSLVAWEYLKTRLADLGLSEAGGVQRTKANCLRVCTAGPVAVVYPEGAWYGNCDPPCSSESSRSTSSAAASSKTRSS